VNEARIVIFEYIDGYPMRVRVQIKRPVIKPKIIVAEYNYPVTTEGELKEYFSFDENSSKKALIKTFYKGKVFEEVMTLRDYVEGLIRLIRHLGGT
jgi:hypothetical protein